MSLVNDMLRDLEARRAAPNERLRLDGLYAVDERAAARRGRLLQVRRGVVAVVLLSVLGLLVALGLLRLFKAPADGLVDDAPSTSVAATPAVQILAVLPQHDARGLVLQLLLERGVAYQRSEESGAISLRLQDTQLVGEPQQGSLQREGRSLSWRVENSGADVQVLLVGLGDSLDVRDRLEAAGDRWMLWVEVPLNTPVAVDDTPLALDNLPPAEAAPAQVEAPMPAWVSAPLPASVPAAAAPPAAQPVAPAVTPQVKIAAHQPDDLTLARQALQDGDNTRAISLLEALQKTRSHDPQVLRWLARAYLAAGDQQRLLDWLPGQLAQVSDDSELRLLLARAQLQAGDTRGAVATLEQNPPRLEQEPTYFALLAASYQQTGQWQHSAELYQRLVALRPGQSTWQLGLAIALEQREQPADAGRHYRLALQGAGLDESARRFAAERAKALGGL
ncbi:tetratricopeptide repeat protein [Pseudomonas sp. SL4(2022)]|uniref:tetratricopeptide repeat protein n=1 Tax=Pseudomonas sp. SL4(2022) TaxID=2994661 RepID=UPI00226EB4C8|nr:tetratricopeptide repeat protein [Pseudomonas sp. SL4(2022)]WAC45813.1 tetratricopeptide repeat protein [Pseudomonas sp. SL4(2022)]